MMNAKNLCLLFVLLLFVGAAYAITPAGTTITNIAEVSYQSSNGLASYDGTSNPVQTEVSGVTQLSITKSGPAQTVAGAIEGFVYSIVVQNIGTTVETGLEVVDALPPQLNFESASQNGVFSNGQIRWTGISLGPGTSHTLTVRVSTDPGLTAQIVTNSAQLVNQGTTIPSNPVETQILQQLTLQKVGAAQKPGNDPRTSQQGGMIDYTITCTNPNPVTIHNVRLIDDLPSFADVAQISAGGSLNGNQVVWVVRDLAPGASQLVQISLQIQNDAPLDILTNIVTATSDELNDVVAQADFGIVEAFAEQPSFDFSKRTDKVEAAVGEEISYAITLENVGTITVENAVIADVLEPLISYVAGSADNRGTYDAASRTMSWGPFASVAPGDLIEVSFRVRVDGPVPVNGGQVENTALLRSLRILDTPSNTVKTVLRGERLDIQLIADPGVILGDGIQTSLLTAMVHKASGALADDGTPVTLTTSRGIFTNGLREISGTALNGVATSQLRSEAISGSSVRADIVAATADGQGGQVTAQASVVFAPAAILGLVTDWLRDSAPVAGVEIAIAGNVVDSVITDANGRYQVPVVQSSTYPIGLSTLDSLGRNLSLVESVEVQAAVGRQFSPANAITGSVLDIVTGQPVIGSRVRILRGTDVVRDELSTDVSGRYSIFGLDPAVYRVELASAVDGFGDESILVQLNQTGQTMINANLSLSRLPSLQLDKIVDKSVAFPGDALNYTISYNNAGGEARNVTLTDALPQSLLFEGASFGGQLQAGAVTWNLGTIPAGGSGNIELVVKVADDVADNTSIDNVATLTVPGDPQPLTASATTLIRQAVLNVAKNADVAQVQPGGQVAFMLSYSNAGGRTATGVTVRDTLPSGTSIVSATPGATQVGQSLTWEVGSLPPGSTQTLNVVLELSETYSDSQLSNSVTVQSNEAGPVSGSVTVDVIFTPILTLEKRANVAQARVHHEILYTIVYQNTGRLDATGVQVTDTLPGEVEYISGGTYNPATRTITWDIGRLIANSAPQSLNTRVRVLETASADQITNVAQVRSNEGPPISAQVTVDLMPEVQADKQVDKPTVKSGEQLTYTLQVSNQGGTATNAVFTDTLPANTTFVSASGSGVLENNIVTWNVGELQPQETRTYTLVLEIAGGVPTGTVIENQGSFHSDQITTTTQLVQTTVENPTLELAKVAPARTLPGERLSYTLNYQNTGSVDATEVVVTDTIPSNTRYVDAGGSVTANAEGVEPGSRITWNIGTVPAGASGSVTLAVEVGADPSTNTISNTAAIQSHETPQVTASTQTLIDIQTGLSLQKEALDTDGRQAQTAEPGDILTYHFTYRNLGNVAANGVVVKDTLPQELDYLDGGSYDAQTRTVTLDIGTLPPKSSAAFVTFRARVVLNLTPQIHEVKNVAIIEDDRDEQNEGTWTVYAMPAMLQVRLVGDRRVMDVGDSTALLVHVENTSIHDLTDVQIIHTLPFGFEYVRGTSLFNGVAVPDPMIVPGEGGTTTLIWTQTAAGGNLELPANTKHRLVFRARLSQDPGRVFSVKHIVRAQGRTKDKVIQSMDGTPTQADVEAKPDEWRLRIRRPMIAGDGIVLGKVFVDKDNDREQDRNELGFPNARLFLEDGRIVVTDEFGKYSIPEVEPGIHVIKLDVKSIPENYQVVRHTTRAAGDQTSQFLDVPADAVEKADFILQEVKVEAEELVASRSVPVAVVQVIQPELGAFAPPIVPEVEIEQPEPQQVSTPVAPAMVEQPEAMPVAPPAFPEPEPIEPVSTPVRMPSVIAPLSPPQVDVHFKPDRIPAGDPIMIVTADQPLTKVIAVHPDGRQIILKQKGDKWQHDFTVPFETPEGSYPFVILVTDNSGREWTNFATVMVDNSIPNIYAEFVPKVLRPGQKTILKVTLLIEATSVTIDLRNGKYLKLKKDARFKWSVPYTIPTNIRRGWHNGRITVIATESNFKQRAIVAYKVE